MKINYKIYALIFTLFLLSTGCTRPMASTPTDIEAVVKLPTLVTTLAPSDQLTQEEQIAQTTAETSSTESESETTSQETTSANIPTQAPAETTIPAITPVPATKTPIPTFATKQDPQEIYGDPGKSFNHSTWNTFLSTKQEESYTLIVDKGSLTFIGHYSQWDTWYHLATGYPDTYIEMTIELEECADNDAYGFIFRSNTFTTNGYILQFSCDGEYSLWRLESSSPYTKNYIVPWTSSSAINAGSYKVNTLAVKAEGNYFHLYANDVLLTEVPFNDTMFPNGTRIAAFISPWETENFTYQINSLNIWRIK